MATATATTVLAPASLVLSSEPGAPCPVSTVAGPRLFRTRNADRRTPVPCPSPSRAESIALQPPLPAKCRTYLSLPATRVLSHSCETLASIHHASIGKQNASPQASRNQIDTQRPKTTLPMKSNGYPALCNQGAISPSPQLQASADAPFTVHSRRQWGNQKGLTMQLYENTGNPK